MPRKIKRRHPDWVWMWRAQVKVDGVDQMLGWFWTEAEARKEEIEFKKANGIALNPSEAMHKAWETRRRVGT